MDKRLKDGPTLPASGKGARHQPLKWKEPHGHTSSCQPQHHLLSDNTDCASTERQSETSPSARQPDSQTNMQDRETAKQVLSVQNRNPSSLSNFQGSAPAWAADFPDATVATGLLLVQKGPGMKFVVVFFVFFFVCPVPWTFVRDCSGSSHSLAALRVHGRPYHLPGVLTQMEHKGTGLINDAYSALSEGHPCP